MAEYMGPSCYKTHVDKGMFYIEAGVFCVEVVDKVSHRVYQRISELYNL